MPFPPAISGDLLTREGRVARRDERVAYSFRSASCLRPSSSYHESYILGGPMEDRSIIHKMHVLERSFLPDARARARPELASSPSTPPRSLVFVHPLVSSNRPSRQAFRLRQRSGPWFHCRDAFPSFAVYDLALVSPSLLRPGRLAPPAFLDRGSTRVSRDQTRRKVMTAGETREVLGRARAGAPAGL